MSHKRKSKKDRSKAMELRRLRVAEQSERELVRKKRGYRLGMSYFDGKPELEAMFYDRWPQ